MRRRDLDRHLLGARRTRALAPVRALAQHVGERLLHDAVGRASTGQGHEQSDQPRRDLDRPAPRWESRRLEASSCAQAGPGPAGRPTSSDRSMPRVARRSSECSAAGSPDRGAERRRRPVARSMTWAPTPACTAMLARLWATESCRSRAIRNRSSTTRRRASSSRLGQVASPLLQGGTLESPRTSHSASRTAPAAQLTKITWINPLSPAS